MGSKIIEISYQNSNLRKIYQMKTISKTNEEKKDCVVL